MTDRRRITPVILSGGSGTRLWPMSRTSTPKQFLSLTAEATMFQLTLERTRDGGRFNAPIVVSNTAHADLISAQLQEAGVTNGTIILEPMARNTAPAIALAALAADADDLLLVMPSDHVINDVEAFRAAVERVAPLVEQGWLATFGITPNAPETGYGYIQRGDAIEPGVHKVTRFVEKPDFTTAQAYLLEGNFSWNGGIFLFTAGAYLEALGTFAPDMLDATRKAIDEAYREGERVYPDAAAFGASPSDSIDYAVMEKAERVAVVPVDMGWSDVGSWDALHALAVRDEHGNVQSGEVHAIDTRNCLIRSDGPMVAAVGISNLIVIATDDAVLIMPRGESQAVKRIIDRLKGVSHATLDFFSRRIAG
ncbi:mannose-1-phosphate guanylyltransferase/mannose-6-phosphate isomerase [Sphingomonas sp. ID0503]|uniref:mannose-1-phosphate guanylyltransferase/mannose-6-phosphate isomerase n=1 Tax=Sphingomonas sp. ID0503 TaxID=3399691 RepID=UPI003AFB28AF